MIKLCDVHAGLCHCCDKDEFFRVKQGNSKMYTDQHEHFHCDLFLMAVSSP